VLLVEGPAGPRAMLTLALDILGYAVQTADDGRTALAVPCE
jgi:hypothetical protein